MPLLPFLCCCSYGDLESKGATIVWGDFSEGVGKLIPEGESFDYVFDNYAKDVDTCKDLADCSKAWCVFVWSLLSWSWPSSMTSIGEHS